MSFSKTDTFFIISNYNTDPERYLEYCHDYHIYDQSTDKSLVDSLAKKYGSKISTVQNTGHNLTDYFSFFIEHYDKLPERMLLGKGNMIGRHVSLEFFNRKYANKNYTFLYDDRTWKDDLGIAYQLYDGAFLEINNSWFVPFRTHTYFTSYNDLLKFLFKEPILPEWLLFSPGACYIISREQVLKYPKVFYENLMTILNYTYFPSEAHQVERMMNIILSGVYELNEHCLDFENFNRKLEEQKILNIKIKKKGFIRNKILRLLNLQLKVIFKLQKML